MKKFMIIFVGLIAGLFIAGNSYAIFISETGLLSYQGAFGNLYKYNLSYSLSYEFLPTSRNGFSQVDDLGIVLLEQYEYDPGTVSLVINLYDSKHFHSRHSVEEVNFDHPGHDVKAVPEPATIGLLAIALIIMGMVLKTKELQT